MKTMARNVLMIFVALALVPGFRLRLLPAAPSLIYYFCSGVALQENPAASGETSDTINYANALHDAKLWIRHQTKWQHPYYWATFTLIGPN
jgi:CHAT domain